MLGAGATQAADASTRGGSTRVLVGLVGLFLATFFGARSCSTFRAVEAQARGLQQLAAAVRLAPAAVLALREQAPELDAADFEARVAEFGRLGPILGDPLAAMAVASPGLAAKARSALDRADGDSRAAWLAVRSDPVALPGWRFLQMRDRFATRDSGRTRD